MIKTPLSTVIGGAFWTPGATVIGGNTPTFDQQILKLFANGEQGFWYDPNDLSTMFQDAAGTIPVTAAGQPVGLMLDKSKSLKLGVEKSEFANGFSSLSGIGAISDSNMMLELSNGVLEITSLSGVNNRAEVPISGLSVGSRYIVSIVCRRVGATGSQTLRLFTPFSQTSYAHEISSEDFRPYLFVLEATAISGVIRLYAAGSLGGAGKLAVESVSVKEVLGNHAYQTTSASRPILRKNAVTGANYLAFDGVDDFMVTVPLKLAGKKELTIHTGFLALPTTLAYEYALANSGGTSDIGRIAIRSGSPSNQMFEVNSGTYVTVHGPIDANRPEKRVICAKFNSIAPYQSFTINGVTSEKVVPAAKDTTLSTLPMYIGRQNTNSWHATMELYGLIIVSTITSVDFDRRTKLDYENKMGI